MSIVEDVEYGGWTVTQEEKRRRDEEAERLRLKLAEDALKAQEEQRQREEEVIRQVAFTPPADFEGGADAYGSDMPISRMVEPERGYGLSFDYSSPLATDGKWVSGGEWQGPLSPMDRFNASNPSAPVGEVRATDYAPEQIEANSQQFRAQVRAENPSLYEEQWGRGPWDIISHAGENNLRNLTDEKSRDWPLWARLTGEAALDPTTYMGMGIGKATKGSKTLNAISEVLRPTFAGKGILPTVASEVAINAGAGYAGTKATEKAAEYTDNPLILGGAGIGATILGAGATYGALKGATKAPGAIDNAIMRADTALNEPARTTGAITAAMARDKLNPGDKFTWKGKEYEVAGSDAFARTNEPGSKFVTGVDESGNDVKVAREMAERAKVKSPEPPAAPTGPGEWEAKVAEAGETDETILNMARTLDQKLAQAKATPEVADEVAQEFVRATRKVKAGKAAAALPPEDNQLYLKVQDAAAKPGASLSDQVAAELLDHALTPQRGVIGIEGTPAPTRPLWDNPAALEGAGPTSGAIPSAAEPPSALFRGKPVAEGQFPSGPIDAKGTPVLSWATAKSIAETILTAPQTLKASIDLSLSLRQGGKMFWDWDPRHGFVQPEWRKAFVTQLKAASSEKAFQESQTALTQRPNYRYYDDLIVKLDEKNANTDIRATGSVLNKGANNPVRISNRAGVAMMNDLRANAFDSKWDSLPFDQKTQANADALRNVLNVATGHANLGKNLEAASPVIHAFMWAPKLLASHVMLPLEAVRPNAMGGNAIARQVALERLLTTVAGDMAILGLGQATGAWEVELDPRSSDFGKGRIGNTRLDPWAGQIQVVRYAAQLLSGESKNAQGDIVPRSRGQTFSTFLRSKASPVFGEVMNQAQGTDILGNPVSNDPVDIINRLFAPLSADDIASAQQEFGWKTAALAALGLLGIGVQSYETPADRTDAAFQEWMKTPEAQEILKAVPADVLGAPQVSLDRYSKAPAALQRAFKEVSPDIFKSDNPSEIGLQIDERTTRLKELNDNIIANKEPLSAWADGAKDIRAEAAHTIDALSKTAQKPPEDPIEAEYLGLFENLPDRSTSPSAYRTALEVLGKWEAENPEDAAYIARVYTGDTEVDKARRAAMAQLAADGYFDKTSEIGTRFTNLRSGLSEQEILDLQNKYSDQKSTGSPRDKLMELDDYILLAMRKEGYETAVIRDVMQAGEKGYTNLKRERYRDAHPELVIWFDPTAHWRDYQSAIKP